jgi:hypothetical protein
MRRHRRHIGCVEAVGGLEQGTPEIGAVACTLQVSSRRMVGYFQ